SDIHGNPIALDAVLADIEAQGGVDSYWLNGDYAALGYDPVGVLNRLIDLPNTVFTRGNTDRYTVTTDVPPPQPETVFDDPSKLPLVLEITRSFSWTRGYVTAHGWYDWLAGLPLEQRWNLPDGTRLLVVHSVPGRDDGPGLSPDLSDDDLIPAFADCGADLVITGHVHIPQDRRIGEVRAINTGSVSNSFPGHDPRASYVILDADSDGYRLDFRRVAYDRAAVLAALYASHHPAGGFIRRMFEA
ncbi:MAG: metallophosphoesterase family protein, partial [Anaerolineae bacterium]|nr:metallophosphoesterase family protein [Anaerolineae bacterium]